MTSNSTSRKSAKLEAELPFHPAANKFRLMDGRELDELAADIQRRGLISPIIVINKPIPRADGSVSIHEMQRVIIDGRNRYLACRKVGAEPRFEEFDGNEEDIPRYIISVNIHRRHLRPDERRECLKQLIAWSPDKSDRALAAETGFDRETVGRARSQLAAMPPVDGRARNSTDAAASDGKRIGRDGKKRRMPTRKAKPNNSKQEAKPATAQTQVNTAHPHPCPCPICREQTGAAQDSIERKQARRLEELESRCHKLQTDNGALQSEVDTLKAEVSKLQQENAELRAKLVPTQTAIAAVAAQTTSIGPMLPDSIAKQADDSPEDDRWIES
jgi:ParB-like chromosome segregation protein Spo0J